MKLTLALTLLTASLFAQPNAKQLAMGRLYPIRQTPVVYKIGAPYAYAFDGSAMWYTSGTALVKVNPTDGSVLSATNLANIGMTQNLVYDGVSFWVSTSNGSLARVKPGDTPITILTGACGRVSALGFDGNVVWAGCQGDNGIYTLAFQNNLILMNKIAVAPNPPSSFVFDGSAIWYSTGSATIYRVAGGVTTPVQMPDPCIVSITSDGTNIYGASFITGRIFQVSSQNIVPKQIGQVNGGPAGILFDGANLWLSSPGNGMLYRLNLQTGTVLSSFGAPNMINLGFDGSDIWVSFYGMNSPMKF